MRALDPIAEPPKRVGDNLNTRHPDVTNKAGIIVLQRCRRKWRIVAEKAKMRHLKTQTGFEFQGEGRKPGNTSQVDKHSKMQKVIKLKCQVELERRGERLDCTEDGCECANIFFFHRV